MTDKCTVWGEMLWQADRIEDEARAPLPLVGGNCSWVK